MHRFGHDVGQLSFGADVEEVNFLVFNLFAQESDPRHDVLHAFGGCVGVGEHHSR